MKVRNAMEQSKILNHNKNLVKLSFEKILEMCFTHINTATQLNSCTCLFEVPEFIIGYPLFNINECIIYISDRLKQLGYKVNYFFPKLLHISWNTEDTQKDRFNKKLIDMMNCALREKQFIPFLQACMYNINNKKELPQIEQQKNKDETDDIMLTAKGEEETKKGNKKGRKPKNKSDKKGKPFSEFTCSLDLS